MTRLDFWKDHSDARLEEGLGNPGPEKEEAYHRIPGGTCRRFKRTQQEWQYKGGWDSQRYSEGRLR